MNYLNLGCGQHFHPEWINVDFTSTGEGVIAHNLRQGIPFATQSVDVVYHSHLLEHLPKTEAPGFLQDCFRVLLPGGVLRVVVPDLEQITRLYLTALEKASHGDLDWEAHYEWLLLEMYDQTVRTVPGGDMAVYLAQDPLPNEPFVLQRVGKEAEHLIASLRQHGLGFQTQALQGSEQDQWLHELLGDRDYQALQVGRFRQGGEVHQWMYDRYSLAKLLSQVGFEQIRVCDAGQSSIPDFGRYGLEVGPDGAVRKPDSLFVEARKPQHPPTSEALPREQATPPTQAAKALADLPYVQDLRQQIDGLRGELERSRLELQSAQGQLKTVRAKLQEFRTALEQSRSIISAMESSKFWQLRSLWIKLKGAIGFGE